jgi:predicted CoA-binding protein
MFLNPKPEEVAKLLRDARTIAVVGLSPDLQVLAEEARSGHLNRAGLEPARLG